MYRGPTDFGGYDTPNARYIDYPLVPGGNGRGLCVNVTWYGISSYNAIKLGSFVDCLCVYIRYKCIFRPQPSVMIEFKTCR